MFRQRDDNTLFNNASNAVRIHLQESPNGVVATMNVAPTLTTQPLPYEHNPERRRKLHESFFSLRHHVSTRVYQIQMVPQK